MMFPGPDLTTLVTITLVAATVNGALGYGFSSLTYDTGAGFVTPDNYQPVAELAKAGIR